MEAATVQARDRVWYTTMACPMRTGAGDRPRLILQRARQLRRELTPAERRLWQHLRGTGNSMVMSSAANTHGPLHRRLLLPAGQARHRSRRRSHADQAAYDAERSRWIEQQKHCRVIRFATQDIHQNLAGCLGRDRRSVANATPNTCQASTLALLRGRSGHRGGNPYT